MNMLRRLTTPRRLTLGGHFLSGCRFVDDALDHSVHVLVRRDFRHGAAPKKPDHEMVWTVVPPAEAIPTLMFAPTEAWSGAVSKFSV